MSCLCKYLTPERAAKAGVDIHGMVCIFCSKAGLSFPAQEAPEKRRFCMDCGDEVVLSDRCKTCATRAGTDQYWDEWRRVKRTPLRERFGVKKVSA